MKEQEEKDDAEAKRIEEEEKKKVVIEENVEALLKSLGLNESLPKLKEHEIADQEMFFSLEDDKIIELLEIKTEGKKMRFKDKMKEVKEKHEKAKAKKELQEEGVDISTQRTFELLQKKSTIIF